MSNAKGAGLERKAKQLLEAAGYLVHRTVSSPPLVIKGKFISTSNNDVFGVFDLVAVAPWKSVRFIQVTVSSAVSARCKKVAAVACMFPTIVVPGLDVDGPQPPPPCTVEVWGWVGGAKRLDRGNGPNKFIRRQYFRELTWRDNAWHDATAAEAGFID